MKKVETDDANRAKSESGKLPEEAQYTIELEGKGKINLYLVRDRLMHLPEAIVKDKEEEKFHTAEFTADVRNLSLGCICLMNSVRSFFLKILAHKQQVYLRNLIIRDCDVFR